ncbi:MAG: MFS transporter [Patescibacteria group bacterium]|nr:MFS transporter [Patescibacteria group bacterium]
MFLTKSPILQVLRIRSFLFLWLGQIFSQLAINMLNFILLLHIGEITGSNTATAVFILCIGVPALLFGSLAGVYVAHWPKKTVLVVCNILRAFLVLAFFFSSESLIPIYIFAFLASIVTQFFVPAEAPSIPTLVPSGLLLSANGLFTLTFYTSVIAGYMLAGPALAIFGPVNVFLLISLLFLTASIFVALLPNITVSAKFSLFEEQPKMNLLKPLWLFNLNLHRRHIRMVVNDFKEGYLFLINKRAIFSSFVLLTMSQVLIATISSLAPGFAREVMRVSLTSISYLMIGPAAFGMIIGAILVGNFGHLLTRKKLINLGIWGAGIFLILLSLSSRAQKNHQVIFYVLGDNNLLFLSMSLLFFLGLANSFIDVPANATLQEETSDELRSRIYGFLTAMVGFFSIFPVFLAGVFSDYFGVVKVIFAMGIGILGFGGYRFVRSKQ